MRLTADEVNTLKKSIIAIDANALIYLFGRLYQKYLIDKIYAQYASNFLNILVNKK